MGHSHCGSKWGLPSPCLFQLLEDSAFLGFWLHVIPTATSVVTSLTLLPHYSSKPSQIIQNNVSTKVFNSVTPAKSCLSCKVTVTGSKGLGHGHLVRTIIQPITELKDWKRTPLSGISLNIYMYHLNLTPKASNK